MDERSLPLGYGQGSVDDNEVFRREDRQAERFVVVKEVAGQIHRHPLRADVELLPYA